ncbi:FBF1 factor, partial [Sapayoa aenigma]|nr:FBF1 factor [Sapayoa aenigma]
APPGPGVTSGGDVDDLMDSLGLGNGPDGAGNAPGTLDSQELQKGRAGMEQLLGKGSVGKILESRPDPKEREQPEADKGLEEPDFPMGSYEPSVASGAEGRPGRRRQLRSVPRRGSRAGAAWLGLRDEEFPG